MISYQLDYIVEEVKKNEPTFEQKNLKKYVGADYTKKEAAYIWKRVVDHKWYMGERLRRDIGLHVAAVDYVENFYDPSIFRSKNKPSGFLGRTAKSASRLARTYFLSKSKTLQGL